MTPLRKKMIDAMTLRGFSPRTHQSYLTAIIDLGNYYHRSPDTLSVDELQTYFLYLIDKKQLAPASCRVVLNAIRFLFEKVLQRTSFTLSIVIPRKPQKIPELLSIREVKSIINATRNLKQKTLLLLCYSCGLRVSELVNTRLTDIDADQHYLRVEHGKGNKDRLVILSETTLQYLRDYWRIYRPVYWLFQSTQRPDKPYAIRGVQRTYSDARQKAGIQKIGGVHSLRHAYATHQLNAGMPVQQLQKMMGHADIRTTMRYIHWVPNYQANKGCDLIKSLDMINEN